MGSSEDRDSFNIARAELFEALGHPTRIRILELLAASPMSFSDLKKALSIESSGRLQFHLGKLDTLVKVVSEGQYALSDEGREALQVSETRRIEPNHPSKAERQRKVAGAVIAILIITTIALSGYAFTLFNQINEMKLDTYEIMRNDVLFAKQALNQTADSLLRNDSRGALFFMDDALSFFDRSRYTSSVWLSDDYRKLYSSISLLFPYYIGDRLLDIRSAIAEGTVTQEDITYIQECDEFFWNLYWDMPPPQWGQYSIINPQGKLDGLEALAGMDS